MESSTQGKFDFKRSEDSSFKIRNQKGWVWDGSRLRNDAEAVLEEGSLSFRLNFAGRKKRLYDEKDNDSVAADKALPLYHVLQSILRDHYANPLSSLTNSKTMLLPHQVQAAIHVVEALRPRILIADEVGLGKTVEAGLIIKELILKYSYKKTLIVVPAPLVFQWQSEMKHKFNEEFTVLNGASFRKNPLILSVTDQVIVSIDTFREKESWRPFLDKNFDIVIFDEAHRLRKDATKATRAYQFAEQIAPRVPAFILMSATPFRGKIEEIYYLIHLIDPDILGPMHTFMSQYSSENESVDSNALRKKISPVVIRRRKKDVGGFTRRFAKTITFSLSPVERVFYDEMTEYVRKEYNRAIESAQSVRAFVMIVFQKLLDSSSHALLNSLRKRKERLENLMYRTPIDHEVNIEEWSYDTWETDVETLVGAVENDTVFDPKEVQQELMSINRLIELGSNIDIDNKLKGLSKTITRLNKKGHHKIIIFTQFLKTLEYIYEHLKETHKVSRFYGALNLQEKEQVISDFFDTTDILICTEAGGEGRNLQVASALINYDLPWSPLKVEQRIGRIHRFGQVSDVYVVNFACANTISERVLNILEKKMKIFEDAFGESDTLLGTMEDDSTFEESMYDLLASKKTNAEKTQELKHSVSMAKDNLHKIDNLLTTEVLDFNMEAFQKVMENQSHVVERSENLKHVVLGYALYDNKKDYEVKYSKKKVVLSGNQFSFSGSFSQDVVNKDQKLEYLTLGHPFVDGVLKKLMSNVESALVYKAIYPNTNTKEGVVFSFEVLYELDRIYKRQYQVFVENSKANAKDKDNSKSKNKNYTISTFEHDLKEASTIEELPIVFEEENGFTVNADTQDECMLQITNDLFSQLEVSLQHISETIFADLTKLQNKIECGVGFWKNNVNSAHNNIDAELSEKLEIQKGKAHWYGENKMISAIQRTLNQKKSEKARINQKINELNNSLKYEVHMLLKNITLIESGS